MRITSGLVGGRRIACPKGVRPTQDRVREAYFSKVAPALEGCRFLDLYSGSGAVGIEAWSRGAAESVLVDSSRKSVDTARKNVEELCCSGATVICAKVEYYLRGAGRPFDLIYADPPYSLADAAGFASEILGLIMKGNWLRDGGIMALERRSGADAPGCEGWALLDSRKYGESTVDYYALK